MDDCTLSVLFVRLIGLFQCFYFLSWFTKTAGLQNQEKQLWVPCVHGCEKDAVGLLQQAKTVCA